MNQEKFQKIIADFPDQPGVYIFRSGKNPVYIGKATSLRDRVRSYFNDDLKMTRTPLVQKAVEDADKLDFQTTDSVLEALILEANLIKKYKPIGNTALMDDKSFNYVVFTDEDYPRVFTVRAHDLATKYDPDEFKYVFGPYTSGTSLKKAMGLIRKIFPFRGQKDPVKRKSIHSPLNEQIGLVPNFEAVAKRDYQLLINNLRLFFEGKKSKLIRELTKQMKQAAKSQEFEVATKLRNTIYALEHINDTSLIDDQFLGVGHLNNNEFVIESYDVAHSMGENMVGVMVVMENGLFIKSRYRKFKIKRFKRSNDSGALKEMLERRLNHTEWPLPKLFVVDGGKAQYNAFTNVLENNGIKIPVVAVTKGHGHKPKGYSGDSEIIKQYEDEILRSNAEAHRFAITWHRAKQRKQRFT